MWFGIVDAGNSNVKPCDRCRTKRFEIGESYVGIYAGWSRINLCSKCLRELADNVDSKNYIEINKKVVAKA